MHRQIDFSFKANVVARWRSSPAQFVPLGIFFDRNRDRSFESGKSLSKSHGNSLRANRGWFITTMFSRTCNLPGVLPHVLGARGNEWAWRNNKWQSVADFNRSRRRWNIGGAIALLVIIPLSVIGGLLEESSNTDEQVAATPEALDLENY